MECSAWDVFLFHIELCRVFLVLAMLQACCELKWVRKHNPHPKNKRHQWNGKHVQATHMHQYDKQREIGQLAHCMDPGCTLLNELEITNSQISAVDTSSMRCIKPKHWSKNELCDQAVWTASESFRVPTWLVLLWIVPFTSMKDGAELA
jgi:hypothetical protein